MKKIICDELPEQLDAAAVYEVSPHNFDPAYYAERTDRNIGWITAEEQQIFYDSKVYAAGCGGMGGHTLANLKRLGIGTLGYADTERFDVSNINRQYAALKNTVGLSKVLITHQMLRSIADDTTDIVYHQGITEETVGDFVSGAEIILDEIEFWAIADRILLHQHMRQGEAFILSSSTVGHRTYLYKYTPQTMPVEELFGIEYVEARRLQTAIQSHCATKDDLLFALSIAERYAAPTIPEYSLNVSKHSTVQQIRKRLLTEGKASIIATNPPVAAGYLSSQVEYHLLEMKSDIKRRSVFPPLMPGYIMIDTQTLEAKRIVCKWW